MPLVKKVEDKKEGRFDGFSLAIMALILFLLAAIVIMGLTA